MRKTPVGNFINIKLTKDEMESICIPETRKVCQTCHKVRINKKINRREFTPNHKRLICRGHHHNQNNNNQQNQEGNPNDINNQGDNNNLNNIGQEIMVHQIIMMIWI